MTIDLKWLLPVALPFGLLAMLRLLWLAAGAEWSDPGMAAGFALLLGLPGGLLFCAHMEILGVKWTVRIGRRDE